MNTEGNMFVYLWYYLNDPTKIKMGETFVLPGQDPWQEVVNRVRQDLGTSRLDYDRGLVSIPAYWDFVELATKVNKNYPKAKFDNYIRHVIGHRDETSEKHLIHFEDAIRKINQFRIAQNLPQPSMSHTAWQHDVMAEVLDAVEAGKKRFLLALCARMGKTPFALSYSAEKDVKLTIVTSYVLSSLTSFANHIVKWEQYRDFVLVDMREKGLDYQTLINDALANNKQVVVLVSMNKGTKRDERFEYLFGLDIDRTLFIDEADYGVHRKGQADLLKSSVKPNDTVFLMTGTNGERASNPWEIDYTIELLYTDLQMYKQDYLKGFLIKQNQKITKFAVNNSLSEFVVDTKYYQLDLQDVYNAALKHYGAQLDSDALPSFTKSCANPKRATGFWTRMFEAMFRGLHNHDEVSLNFQVDDYDASEVSMMFVSGATTNENLLELEKIAKNALPNTHVVAVCGDNSYNGENFTNSNAEELVRQIIEKYNVDQKKPLLIISAGMAQRSFSRPEIKNLFLCFDGGDAGTTVQKISRALTSAQGEKEARIFSMSFDPNRDDKIDTPILSTITNYGKRRGEKDLAPIARHVLSTLDIFSCTKEGAVKFDAESYIASLINKSVIGRVVGMQANTALLTSDEIDLILNIKTSTSGQEEKAGVPTGKTYGDKKPRKSGNKEQTEKDLLVAARKKLAFIFENLPLIAFQTQHKNIIEGLAVVANDHELIEWVTSEYGITPMLLKDFFDRGVLNLDLANLLMIADYDKVQ